MMKKNLQLLRSVLVAFMALLCLPQAHAQLFGPYATTKDQATMKHMGLKQMKLNGKYWKLEKTNKYTGVPCSKRLESAHLTAQFDVGDDFVFGGKPFSFTVVFQVRAYSNSGGLLYTLPMDTMTLNDNQPEQWYRHDFTIQYPNVSHFRIRVLHYTNSVSASVIRNQMRVRFRIEEDYRFRVSSSTNTSLVSVTSAGGPTTFKWSCDCPVSSYELQVLRLFNRNPSYTTDETVIQADIDWNAALSLEVHDSMALLNLAEGSGYYLWRVRPIGNYYEGGLGNVINWGPWDGAAPAVGSVIAGAASLPSRFFYTDPSDNKNYQYSRNFNGAGDHGEAIGFYTGLNHLQQSQAYRQADTSVVVKQNLRDFSGNSVLETMQVPLEKQALSYEEDFLQNASNQLFTADHFDADANYLSPEMAPNGDGGNYYSDANPDPSVPNAEGYPYARTRYIADGSGRTEEIGQQGTHHTIGSGHSTRLYYSGVADQELTSIFGEEAPLARTMRKTITIAPNGTPLITYTSNQGKTLATCLAVGTANTGLEALESRANSLSSITDTIEEHHAIGNYQVRGGTRLALAEATLVNVDYQIWPDTLEADCYDFCATCDYRVVINVSNLNNPLLSFSDTLDVLGESCDNFPSSYTHTRGYSLDPGTYYIEKRILSNNVNPNSVGSGNVLGETYLNQQLDTLSGMMDSALAEITDSIFPYLNQHRTEDLYAMLDEWALAQWDATSNAYTISKGCIDLDLPWLTCDTLVCEGAYALFGDYLQDAFISQLEAMLDEPDLTTDETFMLEVILGHFNSLDLDAALETIPTNIDMYSTTEIDDLMSNMLADGAFDYTCEELWSCWEAVCASALDDFIYAIGRNEKYDPIQQFLNCTGKRYYGINNTLYKSHAYKYFQYTFNDSPDCQNATNYDPANPWPADGDPVPLSDPMDWQQDPYTGRSWARFYDCIHGASSDRPERTPEQLRDDIVEACLESCELHRASFEHSVAALYDSLGWFPDSTEMECLSEMLIDHCEEYCDLTVFYEGGSTLRNFSHLHSSTLTAGKTYKIIPDNPSTQVYIRYDGTWYGPNYASGDEFVAGDEPTYDYSVRPAPTLGIAFRMVEQIPKLDSIGTKT
ncbi:MAG: hypothetical protein ACFB10_24955, partial [Salibacteraceae bacterium]